MEELSELAPLQRGAVRSGCSVTSYVEVGGDCVGTRVPINVISNWVFFFLNILGAHPLATGPEITETKVTFK